MKLTLAALLPSLVLLIGCSDKTTNGSDTAIGDTGTPTDDTDTLPGDDGTVGDDTSAPTDDTTSSTDDTSVPTDDTTSGTDDTTSGTDDTSVSTDDTGTDDTGTSGPIDADSDGFTEDEDCDDSNPAINPDAEEICDGVDNNCDTVIDDDAVDRTTWYQDVDADGYGVDSPFTNVEACDAPEGYSAYDGDCDDTDAAYNPGALEDDCTDPNDYNCDGSVGYEDADSDGFAACEECDDGNPAIHPDAEEVCNDLDDDCDGSIDVGASDPTTFYADSDEDGYGDPDSTADACDLPEGYVNNSGDCDDSLDSVYPGAEETCNEIDDDCDVSVDEDASDDSVWYADDDSDGYGDPGTAADACEAPEGSVADSTDCDDGAAAVNPGAVEICNDIDDDCDGSVDVGASDDSVWYQDVDVDGYGVDSPFTNLEECDAPEGYSAYDGDCDDTDPAYNPGAAEDDCADPNDYNCDGSVAYDDIDGDGWAACEECDDGDAAVNPDVEEICNDIDDDCDGSVDGGASDAVVWYADGDVDGYGDPDLTLTACDRPTGYLADNTDCDDSDGDTNPGAAEVCDDEDDDCDVIVDEDASDAAVWYADSDTDGYGDGGVSVESCEAPEGYLTLAGDCDDSDSAVNPGAVELCNDADDDCDVIVDEDASDVATWYADADVDGYGDADTSLSSCDRPSGYINDSSDCDDTLDTVYPGAPETCNDTDDDCDSTIDEDARDVAPWYDDADSDGFGDDASEVIACDAPGGFISDNTDCNDSLDTVYPGADETCNEVDDDCDVTVDEDASDDSVWYADGDEDGFGDASVSAESCEAPDGYVDDNTDCDDDSSGINPGADEYCNEMDDDCDSAVDEEALDLGTWYGDDDGDGFGAGVAESLCGEPEGYSSLSTDCNDSLNTVYPGADETCNETDDDCDSSVDEDAIDGVSYYLDTDGDGYGDAGTSVVSCDSLSGYSDDNTDCDDSEEHVYPGAPELCDGLANDCDTASTWTGDPTTVTLYPSSGATPIDYTSTFLSGSATSSTAVTISTSGDLEVCPGTYYVRLTVTAAELNINGSDPASVIFDAAGTGQGPLLLNATYGVTAIDGVTFTGGYGCFGGVNVMNTSSCGPGYIGWGSYTDQKISITNSVIADNDSPYGYDYFGGGVSLWISQLSLIDTAIYSNNLNGMYSHDSHVYCEGDSTVAAGAWDNTFYGFRTYDVFYGPSSWTSSQCDFDQGAPNGSGGLGFLSPFVPSYACTTYSDDESFYCSDAGCDYCP